MIDQPYLAGAVALLALVALAVWRRRVWGFWAAFWNRAAELVPDVPRQKLVAFISIVGSVVAVMATYLWLQHHDDAAAEPTSQIVIAIAWLVVAVLQFLIPSDPEWEKIVAEDIPAATQIFTPNWMVRFLVHNTLGRLWVDMHPDSAAARSCEYLVDIAQDKEFATDGRGITRIEKSIADIRVPSRSSVAPVRSVKDIRLLDPACGTMHFGLVAFDLFAAMYREEIERAGQPGWLERPSVATEAEIPAAILAHNLHGIDIDLRAVQPSTSRRSR